MIGGSGSKNLQIFPCQILAQVIITNPFFLKSEHFAQKKKLGDFILQVS